MVMLHFLHLPLFVSWRKPALGALIACLSLQPLAATAMGLTVAPQAQSCPPVD